MKKALVLAAGLGSRLKHKTSALPKALVPVHGEPILAHQLRALTANGVDQISLVLGHEGSQIVEFVERGFPQLTLRYLWNRDYKQSNSSYSFWLARKWIRNEPYLHLNCDILFSATFLGRLIEEPHRSAVVVRRDVALADKMENVLIQDGRIVRMSIQHFPEAEGKAFGLAKLAPPETRAMLKQMDVHLERGDRNQNCYGLIRAVVGDGTFAAFDATGDAVYEVNTLVDLDKVEKKLAGSGPL